MNKPILCVDFDGVIHSYTSGWKGEDVIPDPPVPGALLALKRLTERFDVQIYSSRSKSYAGRKAMAEWLGYWSVDREHGLPHDTDLSFLGAIKFAAEKPAAFLTIDDRAICFDGDWSAIDPEKLLAFKPWNKR